MISGALKRVEEEISNTLETGEWRWKEDKLGWGEMNDSVNEWDEQVY